MFRLFTRLFSRSQAVSRDRFIFRYTVAGQTQHADPLVIAQRFESIGGENWPDLVQTVDRLRKPATEAAVALNGREWAAKRNAEFKAALTELVRVVREVFGLAPLAADGSGVTDHEAIEVLAAYLTYNRGLADAARPLA